MFSIFSPVTFGAQRKTFHPMARSTSVSKIDSWNVIGMGEPGLYDTPDAVARVIHSLDRVCIVGILMVPVMKRTTR